MVPAPETRRKLGGETQPVPLLFGSFSVGAGGYKPVTLLGFVREFRGKFEICQHPPPCPALPRPASRVRALQTHYTSHIFVASTTVTDQRSSIGQTLYEYVAISAGSTGQVELLRTVYVLALRRLTARRLKAQRVVHVKTKTTITNNCFKALLR